MGIWETITDLAEAAKPWSTAEAEAPAAEEEDAKAEATKEEEDDEVEEEEEEDEEELVDPKETFEEDGILTHGAECKESKQCAPAKHHFDECVERVTKQEEDGEAKEDCVEEFFHLAHCATQCAAPKLWSVLK